MRDASSTASRPSPTVRTSRRRSTSAASTSSTSRAEARALEIAAKNPFARYGKVEVRPLMHEARHGRVSQRRARRGPSARARPAGPRRARAPLRPLRRVRGRGAGGAPRGRASVAGVRRARGPEGVAHHGRVPTADRRAPQRRVPPAARGGRRRTRSRAMVRPRPAADEVPADADDTLTLLFLCCHPSLSPRARSSRSRCEPSAGSPPRRSPRAFLVPEATMGQRISRAKQTIQAAGSEFAMPPAPELGERLARRAARPLPDVQRGLHRDVRSRPPPRRPHRGGASA